MEYLNYAEAWIELHATAMHILTFADSGCSLFGDVLVTDVLAILFYHSSVVQLGISFSN